MKGPTFIALHELFDDLAEKLDDLTDTAAERATALGGVAEGTARQAVERSRLPEFPSQTFAGPAVVEALAVRYAALGKSTREAIDAAETLGDAGLRAGKREAASGNGTTRANACGFALPDAKPARDSHRGRYRNGRRNIPPKWCGLFTRTANVFAPAFRWPVRSTSHSNL